MPKTLQDGSLKNAVKIVHNPKVLMDPIRREILRLLAIKPYTVTQLAEILNLTKSTIGHHTRVLMKAGLIRIKWTRIEEHGILEKYYEPIALLFIEDYKKIPREMRKYFILIHMERLRGILVALNLIGDKTSAIEILKKCWKREYESSKNQDILNEMAEEILRRITQVGERYEGKPTELDGESLLTKIYCEVLKRIISTKEWKQVLEKVNK